MPNPDSNHIFVDTPWSVFSVIRDGEGTQYASAVGFIYQQYLPAVYAWLRQRGFGQSESEEIAQDFTTEKLFGALFERADARIGKFRTLLLKALKNHVSDLYRRKGVRHPANVGSALQERGSLNGVAEEPKADLEFDRAWVLRTLEATLSAVENSFCDTDQANYWKAFEQRVLLPIRAGQKPPKHAAVARHCNLRDENHSSIAVRFVKHRFRDEFARQVAMVTECDDDFREELAYYRKLLAVAGECEDA